MISVLFLGTTGFLMIQYFISLSIEDISQAIFILNINAIVFSCFPLLVGAIVGWRIKVGLKNTTVTDIKLSKMYYIIRRRILFWAYGRGAYIILTIVYFLLNQERFDNGYSLTNCLIVFAQLIFGEIIPILFCIDSKTLDSFSVNIQDYSYNTENVF